MSSETSFENQILSDNNWSIEEKLIFLTHSVPDAFETLCSTNLFQSLCHHKLTWKVQSKFAVSIERQHLQRSSVLHTVTLLHFHFHTFTLSLLHFRTFTLSHFHTFTLSHFHTFTLQSKFGVSIERKHLHRPSVLPLEQISNLVLFFSF